MRCPFWLSVLFLIFSICDSRTQHSPELFNYSEKEYKASHQNWSMTCSEDGTLYSANSDGLLVYDGQLWSLYHMPRKKNLRSVYAVGDTVYCGGFQEMGYWTKDNCDFYTYHSLMHLVPEGALDNEEIWHIISDGQRIFFQSFAVILAFDGKKVESVDIPGNIMFLQAIKGEKWLPVIDKGLYIWKENTFLPTAYSDFFADKIVTGIVPLEEDDKNKILISTQKEGLYVLENNYVSEWQHALKGEINNDQINKLMRLPSGEILAGTIREGMLVFSSSGLLKFRINVDNGLQNNSILSFGLDEKKGVWVGLDKGISFLSLRDEWRFYSDNSGTMGTVYTLTQSGDKWYVGTNQGEYVYSSAEKSDIFSLIDGTQGQVWHLQNLGGEVWCGHNDGTFIIKDSKVDKISDITGGWCIEYPNENKEILLQGNYTWLALFSKFNNKWRLVHRLEGYGMPVKKLIRHSSHKFWATGPHTGLKLITVDSSFRRVTNVRDYTTWSGIANNYIPDINLWNGKLRVYDGENHLIYDELKDILVKDNVLNTPRNNDFLFRNLDGNIFAKVYNDYSVLYLCHNDSIDRPTSHQMPCLTWDSVYIPLRLNRDYHTFSLLEGGFIAMCTHNGYAILDSSVKRHTDSEPLHFYKAVIAGQNNCIGLESGKPITLNYFSRNVTFYYRDEDFPFPSDIMYRVPTMGSSWIKTESPGMIRLFNLPVGFHTLHISKGGKFTSVSVVVRPPWYFSWWAIIFYVFILGWAVYFVKRYIRRQVHIQNQKLSEKNHQLLKEKMTLWENERLQKENLSKNKELANATMQLIRKNETLIEIKNELIDIRKKGESTLTAKDFQIMLRQINENLSMKEDENLFHTSFEEIHTSFIRKLKSEYPDLSKDDIMLASYLRMNLSSKEIAPLFKISLRGLENKRYRLRKKMNLPGNLNLNTFFMNYE